MKYVYFTLKCQQQCMKGLEFYLGAARVQKINAVAPNTNREI